VNSVVRNVQELLDIPVRVGAGPAVFLRDVGYVEDSSDILTSYALINGKRSVYIRSRRAGASPRRGGRVRSELPRMRGSIPGGIHVDFAFDQSGYDERHPSLASEGSSEPPDRPHGVFSATPSSAIVMVTILLALLAAVVALWGAGQTINVMTLGGLRSRSESPSTNQRSPSRTSIPISPGERAGARRPDGVSKWRCR
jgi:multidrug efflux pump subunit AcrB